MESRAGPGISGITCQICGISNAFICIHCKMKVCEDCKHLSIDCDVESNHEDSSMFLQRKEDERLLKRYGLE
jgi:hypothetical protein